MTAQKIIALFADYLYRVYGEVPSDKMWEQLRVDIRKLTDIERTKYLVYKELLEMKVVKPEFMANLYKLMKEAEGKMNDKL